MNRTQRAQVGEKIVYAWKSYNRTIEPGTLSFMLDVLNEQDHAAIIKALNSYCINPKNKMPPTIADIMAFINPTVDDEALAIDASSRVVAAVTKFGYNNAVEARDWVGELGWAAVERSGGWLNICENLGLSLQVGTFTAQVREICKAQIKAAKAGTLNTPPALPEPENKKGLPEPIRLSIPSPRGMD